MFGLFIDHFETKRKESREKALKKSLSERLSTQEILPVKEVSDSPEKTEYTMITIQGHRMKVKKEHITIVDVSPQRLSMNY